MKKPIKKATKKVVIKSVKKAVKKVTSKPFEKMTKAEKRIAIAKDVILQIKNKKYIARNGNFCSFVFNKKDFENNSTNLLEMIIPKESIQEIVFKGKKNVMCEVCAKGGLFMSYIGKVDDFKFNQLSTINNDYDTYSGNEIDSFEMTKLREIFSKKQLSMMEVAFEGFEYDNILKQSQADKCVSFFEESGMTADLRLIAICENIIKNKGEFRP